ncbi:hypothetical protein KSS87_006510, partial [Heliosperma pusillum]
RYELQCYNHEVNCWFSNAVGRSCTLWRSTSSDQNSCKMGRSGMCRDMQSSLSFVNEAQFLLISEASVADLNSKLESKLSQAPVVHVSAMRFRPNLVISGGDPYNEDIWRGIKIGSNYFVSLGGCNRCQMINFDHQSGHVQKTREPLATLASYRRVKGRILFGILLRYEDYSTEENTENPVLQVGEEVLPDIKPRSIVEQVAIGHR